MHRHEASAWRAFGNTALPAVSTNLCTNNTYKGCAQTQVLTQLRLLVTSDKSRQVSGQTASSSPLLAAAPLSSCSIGPNELFMA